MQSDAAVSGWIDGRYRLDAVLGRGGMSTVYRAWDTRAERACALKFLDTHFADRLPKLPALFQREFATLGQLAHPSIVEVYDYGIDGERPYYTMELLEGNDLRRLAPLPWRTVCRLLREVASALALLHSRRLIHRDVTASNVHSTADGRAKLMDFGAMTDMGVSPQVVGTPPYIAPEALHGQPLDERVDLFALGALAYQRLLNEIDRGNGGEPRSVPPAAGAGAQITAARGRRPGASMSRAIDPATSLQSIESHLSLLLEESGAAGARVFSLASERPELVARCGACDPQTAAACVAQYADDALLAQLGAQEITRDVARSGWLDSAGAGVRPLLLSAMRDHSSVVAGVLVLWDLPEGAVPPWPLISELTDAVLAHGPSSG